GTCLAPVRGRGWARVEAASRRRGDGPQCAARSRSSSRRPAAATAGTHRRRTAQRRHDRPTDLVGAATHSSRSTTMTSFAWAMMLIVTVHALMFHAMPRFSRPDILFAVTVPAAFVLGA